MIPTEHVRKAARHLYEQERADNIQAGVTPPDHPTWEQSTRLYVQQKYLTRARRILAAVAANIWDEGFTVGVDSGQLDADLAQTGELNPNPYTQESA